MLHYNALATFLAVYRTRSLTKAGQMVNLSQPAISIQLRNLEEFFGRPLFVRGRDEVIPTAPARAFAHTLGIAVDKLDDAWDKFTEVKDTVAGPLRIGGHSGILNNFLIPKVDALSKEDITTHLVPGSLRSLVKDFSQGKIDLLISTFLFESQVELAYTEQKFFYEEKYMLVGHPAWAEKFDFSGLSRGDIGVLCQVNWVVFNTQRLFVKEYIEHVFGKHLPLRVVMTFPEASALVRALVAGMGISVLPDFFCRRELESGRLIELCKPIDPPKRSLYVVYNRRSKKIPRIQAAIEQFTPEKA